MSSQQAPLPPSPDASRAAILGAASNGWSPQRSHKRDFFSPPPQQYDDDQESVGGAFSPTSSASGSPGKLASRTFDPSSLKGRGYVSNSVFKKPGTEGSEVAPPPASPTRMAGAGRGASSPKRAGLGLGIGVSPGPQMGGRMEGEHIHQSAVPARQSKAYENLKRNSYVSSSPFKSSNPEEPRSPPSQRTRPLSVSNSSSMQRTGSSSPERPSTPSRKSATPGSENDSLVTPRASSSRRPVSNQTSSTAGSRGTLASDRLHEPRRHRSPSKTSGGARAEQERRKTVTFDEELEVQEFDRESSFEAGSLQSGSSDGSLQQQQPSSNLESGWGGSQTQLVVVNGASPESSPNFSDEGKAATDMLDALSTSSSDSREMSSSGTEASEVEPRSPERQQFIEGQKRGWSSSADGAAGGAVDKDASMISMGGLSRVDSLVDELLQEADGLGSTKKNNSQGGSTSSPAAEQPIRRGFDRSKPPPRLSAHLRETSPERSLGAGEGLLSLNSGELPQLPTWSPLSFGDAETMEPAPKSSPPLPPPSPRRNGGGRPHISRDAVLERVAREKREEEAAQKERQQAGRSSNAGPSEGIVSASQSASEVSLKGRPSAPGLRGGQSTTGITAASQRPQARPHPEARSYEVKAEPQPSPVREKFVDGKSPLDRLGEKIVAEEADGKASLLPAMEPSSPWFNSVTTMPQVDERSASSSKTGEANLALPGSSGAAEAQTSPAISTSSSGSASAANLTPAQHADLIIARRRSKKQGRRRRSVSTSDARLAPAGQPGQRMTSQTDLSTASEDTNAESSASMSSSRSASAEERESIRKELASSKLTLDSAMDQASGFGFGNGLCRDISRIFKEADSPYKVQDRGSFAAAEEKVSHSRQAGDVDAGKAWRKLRRPSDINEYADQMREYRANENPKKATGKVFVRVDSYQPANMALPSVPSKFYCILDNGLHVVKTGLSTLSKASSPIGQEFELIQHKNLEFSLTLFVQNPPAAAPKEPARPASPTKKQGSVTKSFVNRLLRSPKKAKAGSNDEQASAEEAGNPLSTYTNREGALGRVDLVFENVAAKCLGKCLTIDLPVRGVADPVSTISTHNNSMDSRRNADFSRNLSKTRGTLRLKLFYLPPMPSVPKKVLPENLKECLQGMDDAYWHMDENGFSGTLTQQGGDCSTWRRRPVRAQGRFLICFNDITKRPIVRIDLSKASSIDQNWDPYDPSLLTADEHVEGGKFASKAAMLRKYNANEEPDETYHVPNSFRITFSDGEVITFFADTDEERKQWVKVLKEMVHSKHGPCPLWAQVVVGIIKDVESKKTSVPASTVAPSQAQSASPSKKSVSSEPMEKCKSAPSAATTSSAKNSANAIGNVASASRMSSLPSVAEETGKRASASTTGPSATSQSPSKTSTKPAATPQAAAMAPTASALSASHRKQVPSVHSLDLPAANGSTKASGAQDTSKPANTSNAAATTSDNSSSPKKSEVPPSPYGIRTPAATRMAKSASATQSSTPAGLFTPTRKTTSTTTVPAGLFGGRAKP
ncbi:unnamed protein product [Jaminaea pallidilutea]